MLSGLTRKRTRFTPIRLLHERLLAEGELPLAIALGPEACGPQHFARGPLLVRGHDRSIAEYPEGHGSNRRRLVHLARGPEVTHGGDALSFARRLRAVRRYK